MKSKESWGRRGYIYTVSVIILMVPLTLLLLFYTGTEKTKVEDTSARIRCDELYYFVQDVEYDMGRAMLIFGRRAATYATDCVTNLSSDCAHPGWPLANYTFNSTSCPEYNFTGNASEAAIAELIVCGTMYGQEVAYMENYTLPTWLERIDRDAREVDYDVNITVLDFEVLPYDAWNFSTSVTANLQFSDNSGYCYYIGENRTVSSMTSIVGLEDPLFRLNTLYNGSKIIYNCEVNMMVNRIAGCSDSKTCSKWDCGVGIGSGKTVLYSDLKANGTEEDYCSSINRNNVIVIADLGFGSADCQKLGDACLNASNPNHLGGLINYAKVPEDCNATIPWIYASGDITGDPGHPRSEECDDYNVVPGDCVLIKNIGDGCDVHEVRLGYNLDNVNTTCYVVSDSSKYASECATTYADGGSFFDRLDGRTNLSDYYAQQAEENFGSTDIGIETVVTLDDLKGYGLEPDTDATWVDYLYWQGKEGWAVGIICGESTFKLDCQHAYFYTVDTDNTSGAGIPPASEITSPENDALFTGCPVVSINGTADDCDNEVSSVEVGINGVWYDATYSSGDWNYTLDTDTSDRYDILSRAKDVGGIKERPSGGITIFIVNCTNGDNTRPNAPVLIYPNDGRTKVPRNPTFYWNAASDASGIYRYQIQVDDDPADWSNTDIDAYAWDTEYTHGSLLQNNHWFGWRVRAQDNAGNWGPWSSTWRFKT